MKSVENKKTRRLRQCQTVKEAARALKVSQRTFYRWLATNDPRVANDPRLADLLKRRRECAELFREIENLERDLASTRPRA
jgi:hypothetical protein